MFFYNSHYTIILLGQSIPVYSLWVKRAFPTCSAPGLVKLVVCTLQQSSPNTCQQEWVIWSIHPVPPVSAIDIAVTTNYTSVLGHNPGDSIYLLLLLHNISITYWYFYNVHYNTLHLDHLTIIFNPLQPSSRLSQWKLWLPYLSEFDLDCVGI